MLIGHVLSIILNYVHQKISKDWQKFEIKTLKEQLLQVKLQGAYICL